MDVAQVVAKNHAERIGVAIAVILPVAPHLVLAIPRISQVVEFERGLELGAALALALFVFGTCTRTIMLLLFGM